MRQKGAQCLLNVLLHEKKEHDLRDLLGLQPKISGKFFSGRLTTHEHDAPPSFQINVMVKPVMAGRSDRTLSTSHKALRRSMRFISVSSDFRAPG
jgi:hypothetical protein